MAQVYSFVDDNGVTRLFAEIHPDPAGTPFNGGTIGALFIDNTGAPSVTALEVDAAPDQSNSTLDVNGTHGGLSMDNEGGVTVSAQAALTSDLMLLQFAAAYAHNVLNVAQNFSPFATVLRVNMDGYLGVASHAAPADGDVATGECMLWFDQTNGAGNTKLMVKGKSADGTVKTATILLA